MCTNSKGKIPAHASSPVFGHNFGHVSSVINYNRTPELMVHAATTLFLCPCHHYFDDYNTPDVKGPSAKNSLAQDALAVLHREVGLILEPNKHEEGKSDNVFLGVRGDISHASDPSDPRVIFTPTEGRTDRVLSIMRECRTQNWMDQRQAEVLLGKLQFISQHSFGAVGRAATQPLVTRSGKKEYSHRRKPEAEGKAWSEAMGHMLLFFETLFRRVNGALANLPPLVHHLGCPRRKRVVVYTDAQYNPTTKRAGLGVIIVDTESDTRLFAGALTSPEIMGWLDKRDQQINQLELLAALCAMLTFPELFEERSVLFWIDNTSALSACIHGYTHSCDMAKISNMLHLSMARLQSQCWFKHVPGEANPADLPSRADFITLNRRRILNTSDLKAKDREAAEFLNAYHSYRELVMSTVAQLDNLEYFITKKT